MSIEENSEGYRNLTDEEKEGLRLLDALDNQVDSLGGMGMDGVNDIMSKEDEVDEPIGDVEIVGEDEPKDVLDVVEEEEVVEDVEAVEEEPVAVEETSETKRKKKYTPGSRSEKRIKQLIQERKDKEASLAEERNANAVLRERLNDLEASDVSSKKRAVDSEIQVLSQQIVEAKNEMDYGKEVELNTKMSSLIVSKNRLDDWVAPANAPAPAVQQNTVDVETQTWVDSNPWFLAPTSKEEAYKINLARAINERLIVEKFDPTSQDFFEELDYRLEKELGKVATPETGKVDLDQDVVSVASDETEKTAQKKVTKKRQVVQGASRTPPKKKAGTNTIASLTKQEVAIAEKMGVTAQQYLEHKLKIK